MTFPEFINRLLALRLLIKSPYWLQFKLGSNDFFSVSIGKPGFQDYKNSKRIFCKPLCKIDPMLAWETVNDYCQKKNLLKGIEPDLFNRKEQK